MALGKLARKIFRTEERARKRQGKKFKAFAEKQAAMGARPVAQMASGRIVHIDPKKHKLDLRSCPGCGCFTTHKTECPNCHAEMPEAKAL